MDQNLIVATCSWFGCADLEGVMDKHAMAYDIHAGDSETSAMLAAKSDLVDMDLAENFVPAMRAWEGYTRFTGLTGQAARPGWIIDDLNANGACGDASAATAEKGIHLLDTAAENFAAFLAEFSRFDHRR